jgi:hypothetical protein
MPRSANGSGCSFVVMISVAFALNFICMMQHRGTETPTFGGGGGCWTFKTYLVTHLPFLGVFAKLRKATITSVMALSVRMEELGSHWTGFHAIWHLCIFENMSIKFEVYSNLTRIMSTLNDNQYPLTLTLLMSYIYIYIKLLLKPEILTSCIYIYMDPRLATLKAVSFYLLHNVSTLNQCRKFSCVTVVCKHFASYQD